MKKSVQIIPVILCGGGGKRLWPFSRDEVPKPFISIGGKTLFQQTLQRFNNPLIKNIVIVASEFNEKLILDHIDLNKTTIHLLLEPHKRNTGPAIASAVKYIKNEISSNVILNICPSDHFISNKDYIKILKSLIKIKPDKITCYGIKPTYASSQYGYITENKESLKFTEKPAKRKANLLFKKGNSFWNSGIFSSYIDLLDDAFNKHLADYDNIQFKISSNCQDIFSVNLKENVYKKLPNISFDYLIMEKSKNIDLVKTNISWSDIGTWGGFDTVLHEYQKENGNYLYGNGLLSKSVSTSIISNSDKTIVAHGLNNISIIDTNDSTLIINKELSNDVSDIYNHLKVINPRLVTESQSVQRLWGSYQILISTELFKVKKIILKPHSSISNQKHLHRYEHWIVVDGKIDVITNNKKITLAKNDSIDIKINTKHKMINNSAHNATIIEVQTGDYLGEDDIIRYD